jgi:hypothetical protein
MFVEENATNALAVAMTLVYSWVQRCYLMQSNTQDFDKFNSFLIYLLGTWNLQQQSRLVPNSQILVSKKLGGLQTKLTKLAWKS